MMNENPLSNFSYSSLRLPIGEIVENIKEKIRSSPHWTRDECTERLGLVDGLILFPLGRFLLQNGALNGEWSHYISTYPLSPTSPEIPLEHSILTRFPTIKAMQQQLRSFCKILQKQLFDGIQLCSIPCGWMDELFLLNYRGVKGGCLTGIDLDPLALQAASELSKPLTGLVDIRLLLADAWEITNKNEFDLISCNGLNIYEKNESRLFEFYKRLIIALKPGGMLLTSFLTPPPGNTELCEWRLDKIDLRALASERMLFEDILKMRWQNYRTSAGMIELLKCVGFTDIQIVPDEAHVFPTVVARKPAGGNDKLAKFWEELSIKKQQGRDIPLTPQRRKHRRGAPFST